VEEIILVIIYALIYSSHAYSDELTKSRVPNSYDHCSIASESGNNDKGTSFDSQINKWIDYYNQNDIPLEMEEINSYYNVKEGLKTLSFRDLNFCSVDKNSIAKSLKNIPDNETISLLHDFFKSNIQHEKIFSCLALEESLGDPDTTESQKIYTEVTGEKSKPSGVKFYRDRLQPKESELNIGLFQFTPNINGNIHSCVMSWNKIFKTNQSCQIKNNKDVIDALSTNAQNFNVYCGLHKILETASIQLKSNNANAHFHPGEECVSLHMRAGLAYNHFGPLQNSTGRNLASIAKCFQRS
jgi:hypothetical protein